MNINETPYSNLKIFGHTDRITEVMSGNRIAPIYIRIKPTNLCNQNCNYCHYKNPYLDLDQYNYNDLIPHDKMIEIIEDMKIMDVKAVTFSGGGEPLLYPYIEETMEKILKANIDLSIITNASLLHKRKAKLLAKAKWVRVSLDAASGATYEYIRGLKQGAFDEVCCNIEDFAKIKDEQCELGVNFVVGKDNYKEVYDAGKLMKNLGVNHIKYTAQCSTDAEQDHVPFKENVIEQIHTIQKEQNDKFKVINLYEQDFDTCVKFSRTYPSCHIKDYVCVIAANCKVYYCHDKAYLSNGEQGDIQFQSFKEMWYSKETIEKSQCFEPLEECKHHCVYDERNLLLNSFFNIDTKHINFI